MQRLKVAGNIGSAEGNRLFVVDFPTVLAGRAVRVALNPGSAPVLPVHVGVLSGDGGCLLPDGIDDVCFERSTRGGGAEVTGHMRFDFGWPQNLV